MQIDQKSVMIVSKAGKMLDYIKLSLPPEKFSPVHVVSSAVQARQTELRSHVDIVIINTPLPDEFGTKLAQDLSVECAVVIIVNPELAERVTNKLEPFGIVTLPSKFYKTVFFQTISLLASSVTKMETLRKESETLKSKLREMKTLSKAKSLLISEKGMTEEQAHRYIEKSAMDGSMKKLEIARLIIEELSDDDI